MSLGKIFTIVLLNIIKETPNKNIKKIKSKILSITIVAKTLEKDNFSFLLITKGLNNSPNLGIGNALLAAYPIITAENKLSELIPSLIGFNITFHLKALKRWDNNIIGIGNKAIPKFVVSKIAFSSSKLISFNEYFIEITTKTNEIIIFITLFENFLLVSFKLN